MSWVRLNYPPQFRLGLETLARRCEWRVRRGPDGTVAVTPAERYSRVPYRPFLLTHIVDAANASDLGRYESIAKWAGQDELARKVDGMPDVRQFDWFQNPKDGEEFWTRFRLGFMSIPDAEVVPFISNVMEVVAAHEPGASLWTVSFSPSLQWRLAAVRALFAATQAPDLLSRMSEERSGRLLFPASQSFMRSQTYGFSVYLEPALLVTAPWLLGVPSYRLAGTAIVAFAPPLSGIRAAQAPEVINILRPVGFTSSHVPSNRPEVTRPEAEATLRWWVSRLNALFSLALDVTRYRTPAGDYDPTAHIGVLMSLERLFSVVQGALAHASRDPFARYQFAGEAFDIIDGLGGYGNWHHLVTHRKTDEVVRELERRLPHEARDTLLRRPRRASAALAEVADGFVADRIDDDRLRVPTKGGGSEDISLDRAAAEYLRLARNASHSYRDRVTDPRDVALLTSHEGNVPDELSDLALLHLLRMLDSPRLPPHGRANNTNLLHRQ